MLPTEQKEKEIDYIKFMEWLSTSRLCCTVNTAVTVYGHNACWDCFKVMRPAVTDIHMNFEITSTVHIIKWEGHDS